MGFHGCLYYICHFPSIECLLYSLFGNPIINILQYFLFLTRTIPPATTFYFDSDIWHLAINLSGIFFTLLFLRFTRTHWNQVVALVLFCILQDQLPSLVMRDVFSFGEEPFGGQPGGCLRQLLLLRALVVLHYHILHLSIVELVYRPVHLPCAPDVVQVPDVN